MQPRSVALAAAIGSAALLGAFFVGRAAATGAPVQTPLVYSGVVTDAAGQPYKAPQEVVVKFYDKADATSAKCTAAPVQAEANSGRFSVVLPAQCAQAVHDAADLWAEATVAKTVLPRVHVAAVPYALETDVAKVAAGLQCVGCVTVAAMKFDKNVDLQGHELTTGPGGAVLAPGKLDLGPGVGDELSGAQVKTLTGGGNADALHTHTGLGGGGGGQVISYKGLSLVARKAEAGVGLSTFDSDCHAAYAKSRMCTEQQVLESFPAPVPGAEAFVRMVPVAWFQSLAIGYTGQTLSLGNQYHGPNCGYVNSAAFTVSSVGGSNAQTMVLNAKGDLLAGPCATARPAACCGP